jgi:hypothetical protein
VRRPVVRGAVRVDEGEAVDGTSTDGSVGTIAPPENSLFTAATL